MAKTDNHMIYRFYFKPTDSYTYETENYKNAQRYARHIRTDMLPDYAEPNNYTVYIDRDGRTFAEMSVADFMEFPNPNPLPDKINFDVVLDDTPASKPSKELEKEPFHNLDDKETMEVLKYTDTGFILGELARRLEEYNAFTQTIKKALDQLDINA